MEDMFAALQLNLAGCWVHVAVSGREGANRNIAEFSENTRAMRVHGYNRKVMNDEGIRFDRLPELEDFDVTLQLLEKGYPNRVLNSWVHNQAGSNTEGGCSSYRTIESHNENVEKFAAAHPQYVTVVQKQNKGEWGTRKDVRIQWKQAYNPDRTTRSG